MRPTIDRLRALIANAGAAPLPETPAHPDAELLDLCARVLDGHAEYEAIYRQGQELHRPFKDNPEYAALMEKREGVKNAWRSPMSLIGKFPAKTPAGVYAKATVLRGCHGTAPRLALSLAHDLTNCPGLRAALWPAEGV